MNQENIEPLVKQLLIQLGEDPSREGLLDTPRRVAKSFNTLYGGYNKRPEDVVTVFDNEGYDEMIIAKDIDFFTTCEHHMLPFYGKAYIGYIPNDKIIGLSKMPRLVEIFARRLQNQERLTKQVADALTDILNPKGVGVVIQAEHLCMKARGVEKQNCSVSTSSFTGLFKKELNTRSEFLRLISY